MANRSPWRLGHSHPGSFAEFHPCRLGHTRLKAIVAATDGNLGAHIGTLEQAAYVTVTKDFNGKKPRTRIAMTRGSRRAFARHVAYLRDILDGDTAT
jgi:hypothetical protein